MLLLDLIKFNSKTLFLGSDQNFKKHKISVLKKYQTIVTNAISKSLDSTMLSLDFQCYSWWIVDFFLQQNRPQEVYGWQ